MSAKGRIKAGRLSSFLIYSFSAIWLFSGCATKSSLNTTASGSLNDSQAPVNEKVSMNDIQTDTDMKLIPVSDRIAGDKPETATNREDKYIASEPRIILEPGISGQDQIIGIDFTMLEQGRSRLTVTTGKEVKYDLDRKGKNELTLNLYDISIPPLLLREIDTTHFQSALSMVKPVYSDEKNKVTLGLTLREMVPFHIKQSDKTLTVDFGPTAVKVPDMKIVPLNLVEAETRNLAAGQAASERHSASQVSDAGKPAQYTGERMSLDFIDTDVTHLFRLMNEVSEENIIWDPAIKGQKVSMILKDVPWDEALELILKNNDLAKRYVGRNIIWITTKQKMMQILAEEEAEARKMEQQLEAERQRLQEQKVKAEEDAPLITEYLPVDFAKADEIQKHIVLSDRGKMSIDTRTNTIIVTDVAAGIEKAKNTIRQFDAPVKQIMIEARIVDASENFSRDLGIKWNSATSFISNNEGNLNSLQDGASFSNNGEEGIGGSFSTNAPEGWAKNIGMSYGFLSSNGLSALTLDASLALAESTGTAKTLSAPKVIAQEGTSSRIVSGEKIYTTPTENVSQEERDAALTLNVTPTSISYNDYITLEITVTDNKNVNPTLDTTKEIQTTLMVKSGETIVIGGIIKENEGDIVSGVPVLKDIPGLGWLFKAKNKTLTKSEMLIFLTPTVLPSPVKSFK